MVNREDVCDIGFLSPFVILNLLEEKMQIDRTLKQMYNTMRDKLYSLSSQCVPNTSRVNNLSPPCSQCPTPAGLIPSILPVVSVPPTPAGLIFSLLPAVSV